MRETTHRETGGGQGLKVVQLFKMAIANVAPCLVPLPDNARIAGFGVSLGGLIKGRVPTPRIRARYLDSALLYAAAAD